MKQSDIANLLIVVTISLALSFFIAGAIINTDESRSAEVEQIRPIDSSFNVPDEKIFNEDSINPTELINIGGSQSSTPFEDGASTEDN